jgi:hypothetical protein
MILPRLGSVTGGVHWYGAAILAGLLRGFR